METGSASDWAMVVLTAIGALFAVGQFAFNSYRDAARAAADEIEKFNDDETVRTALRMIDWQSGTITFTDSDNQRKTLPFDSQLFQSALRPHTKRRDEIATYDPKKDVFAQKTKEKDCEFLFSEVEQHIRDQFDRFLGHLERIESLIDSHVVSKKGFGDNFSYWLDLISGFEPGHFNDKNRRALIGFIRFYRFKGVLHLFERYGRPLAP